MALIASTASTASIAGLLHPSLHASMHRSIDPPRISSSMDSFSSDKDFDVFLAELVFSQSDVRDDVLKNLDKAADER